MAPFLEQRRQQTERRFQMLRKKLREADEQYGSQASVFATGSFARGEASVHSDLDLFIVSGDRSLRNLDAICLKARLIELTRKTRIADFSGDGEYLTHYTVDDLVGKLGKPEDDVVNTFTARLLLLLESQPLLGDAVYFDVLRRVIKSYWRDYDDHSASFMPAFLANDILRMWRTFCVNYEARTSSDPPAKKAKRKLKNYKLKHSRLLTCYSALIYLLGVHAAHGTVTPNDAIAMIQLSPTGRLEWAAAQAPLAAAQADIAELLRSYELCFDYEHNIE